jgi:hypothetical protein
MRIGILICALLLASCAKQEPQQQKLTSGKDEQQIEEMISQFYKGMERVYNEGVVNSDSLLSSAYDPAVHYVTPWGWTEPLDTTKARLRRAYGRVKNYSHHLEIVDIKSYGDVAYAFFTLRQEYTVDGRLLEEYLPTTVILERKGDGWKIVHAHRSTDYETMQQYVAQQQPRTSKKK